MSFVLSAGEARRTGYSAMRVQVTVNAFQGSQGLAAPFLKF